MPTQKSDPLSVHFPEIYSGEGDLIVPNDVLISISVFDHWLTETEASGCSIMNYEMALVMGAEKEYLIGESRFRAFYSTLAHRGVILNSGAKSEFIAEDDSRLYSIIFESLREIRPMDIYFVEHRVRAMGGYDRTDLLMPADARCRSEIESLARRCGLFVLHPKA